MSPTAIILLLLFIGAVLLVGELFLPTHGILGILGGVLMLIGVGYCFAQSPAVGTALFLGLVVVSPFAWSAAVKWWPKTPVGKRMVLQPIVQPQRELLVSLGQNGRAISALRPTGLCEFGNVRIEAQSELEMIEPGSAVKVVAVDGGKVTVRSV